MGEHQGMGEGDAVQLQYRPRHAVGRLCGAAACGQGPKKLLQLWQWRPPTTLACLAAGACINKEKTDPPRHLLADDERCCAPGASWL